jgi:hypothetical protein
VTIYIERNELLNEVQSDWAAGLIGQASIDYATNCIHAWCGEREVIVFSFRDYGFIHDNRFNRYELKCSTDGIVIRITKSRS